jgi:acyl-CoA reductase-like NAD-dependent aldehyde dehydrogenase
MIGNTIVLKPASATMQCGIEIEKTFAKASATRSFPNDCRGF